MFFPKKTIIFLFVYLSRIYRMLLFFFIRKEEVVLRQIECPIDVFINAYPS